MRRLVGLVSDETSESQSAWTAREYLCVLRAHPAAAGSRRAEVETLLDRVGLDARFRGKLIGTYSTGMKRRVEIARALMGRPKVLFLDEPTRGLDLPAKRDMWNLLRELAATEKRHDVPQQPRRAGDPQPLPGDQRDREGRVVFTGATRELGGDLDAFEERLIELLTQPSPTTPS